jgi:phage-related holin
MFYGIKVACKQNKKIESHKGWKGTLTKLADEMVIISLARLLELAVLGEQGVFVLTGGSTVIIALTELWSILENLNTLNPDGPWKALGKFLKKKGEDYTGIEIDLNDEHTNNPKLDSIES